MPRLPYVGFRPYEKAEASYFCGRQGEISVLHDAFTEQAADRGKLLIIYGPSAVGKTSLVQAGLWPVLQMNKEASELLRLTPKKGESLRDFNQRIRHSVGRMSPSESEKPLVFIDQLEELMGYPLDGDLDQVTKEQFVNMLEFLSQATHKNIARVIIGIREPWSHFLEDAPHSVDFLQGNLDFFRLNYHSSSGLEEILRTPLYRWKNGGNTTPDQVDNSFFKQFYGELNANPLSLPIANLMLEEILQESEKNAKPLEEAITGYTLLDYTLKHADAAFAKWSEADKAKLPVFIELFCAAGLDSTNFGVRTADARPLIVDPDAREVLHLLLDSRIVCIQGNNWRQAEVQVCNDRFFSDWGPTTELMPQPSAEEITGPVPTQASS